MPQSSLSARVWLAFIAAIVIAVIILLHGFLFPPPPNYAVVALGGLAVAMTLLLRKEPRKGEKAAWMLAAFLLMFLEMWAITRDRGEQEERHIVELKEQQLQFNNTLIQLGLIKAGVQKIPDIEGVRRQQRLEIQRGIANLLDVQRGIANLPQDSFLRRIAQLAQDINTFLAQRNKDLAQTENSLPSDAKEAAFLAHHRQTIVLFEQQFGMRCRGIAQELMTHGASMDSLNMACKFPPGTDYLSVSSVPGILAKAIDDLR
jgi:hypothetical protein